MRYYNEPNVRKQTCHLLELVEEGVLDADYVLRSALLWLSESDVVSMSNANALPIHDEVDEDEEEDEQEEA